jgi:hypothetical protein
MDDQLARLRRAALAVIWRKQQANVALAALEEAMERLRDELNDNPKKEKTG